MHKVLNDFLVNLIAKRQVVFEDCTDSLGVKVTGIEEQIELFVEKNLKNLSLKDFLKFFTFFVPDYVYFLSRSSAGTDAPIALIYSFSCHLSRRKEFVVNRARLCGHQHFSTDAVHVS